MSRRKQSKPRQIKRSPGDLDGAEDNAVDSLSLSGEEGGVSDPEDSADGDASSRPSSTPLYEGLQDCQRGPDGEEGGDPGSDSSCQEEQEELVKEEEMLQWTVPDELDVREEGGARRVVADSDLHPDTTWGPYPGAIQSEAGAEEESEDPKVRVVCEDPDCWLGLLPLTCDASASNCSVSSRGGALFCKVSRALSPGEVLLASVMPPPGSSCSPPSVKEEPLYPAALHSDIQLLPQQAGMAAILATAVVNKDIFPCKDCGIWYRSERNLQAHLMYYCASRQKAPSAASSPPQDKPKESYPNERVCPFPQCNKSCPSASSLEIHMRTHSAFTTKANCERHLKVHTDTLNGVCHGCGFVSTTRDILYSHLVTSHMVCQPGSHSEVYSPGPGLPKVPVSTGLGPGDSGVVLKCQVCGHNSDSPSQLQQHVRTHLEVRVPAERSPTPRQSTPSDHTLLRLEERQVAVVPKPESSSPGANGSSATPRGCSPAEGHAPPLQIKEEPRSDDEGEEQRTEANGEKEEEQEQEEEQDSGGEAEPAARSAKAGRLGSPTSPVPSAVKAEPTSPTPGSSPAHAGGAGPVVPGGALFLPQYMFNPEAAILPQASEILAKMSEMVHSRLKQGQSVPQNSPAPNAFFPPGAAAPTAAATPPHAGATCFECDITFNNINNFYAHKRLYCSSRHHGEGAAPPPGAQLAAASSSTRGAAASPGAAGSRAASASPSDSEPPAGGAESQRPVDVKLETPTGRDGISSSSEGEGGGGSVGGGGRTSDGSQSPAGAGADESEDDPNRTFCQACNIRFSRHDNYTVHKRFYCASRHDPSNQRSLHVPKAPAAAFLPQPIRTRKRKKMYEIHMARTEALANAAAAAAAAAATASAPSPSVLGLTLKREASPSGARGSSPEGDAPMDLSKRPRLREAPPPGGAGAGVLPVLPLSDYHKCTACSISFNSIENYLAHKTYYCPATTLQPHTLEQLARIKRSASRSPKARPPDLPPGEAKALPAERAHEQGASSSPLASAKAASPSPRTPPSAGSPQVICPYCPTRLISCDLMEHFRTAHGLVVSVQPPQEPLALPESPCRSPRDGPSSGATGGTNGQVGSAPPSPASPPVNGDASPSSSPRGAPSRTLSPVPENLSHLPPQAAAPTPQPAPPPATKGAAPPPVPNGGSRFCRLCNIKFSSLSTFIAHKKYYCSSHSAEHVK